MRALLIPTPTTGRVLVDHTTDSTPARLLVGCHGYGQNAQVFLEEMRSIPGAEAWRLVAVQALHRFYTRGDQVVVASWMTREDRDAAIADNIEYVNRAVSAALEMPDGSGRDGPSAVAGEPAIVYLGFSQGASMAVRAAVRGKHRAAGLIMLGGDIPPDVRDHDAGQWPPVLLGCGDRDEWYAARVESDIDFLRSRRIAHDVIRFAGGHEFTDEFRAAAGQWLLGR